MTWMALSPFAKPSLINGSRTQYSSSSSLKKAQMCRVSYTTEPAKDIGVTAAGIVTFSAVVSVVRADPSIAEPAAADAQRGVPRPIARQERRAQLIIKPGRPIAPGSPAFSRDAAADNLLTCPEASVEQCGGV